MGATTEIAWTDRTFNPWEGCNKVSPGCDHCYAETRAHRLRTSEWGPPALARRGTRSEAYWREPLKWNRHAQDLQQRERVFCASLADVFEFDPLGRLDPLRTRLWSLIESTPWLDWQLLTKRPMNIARMLPTHWLEHPQPNVWLGTSVEDQQRAELRIPHLVAVPAAVHFLSCEPLIGPVDLHPWLTNLEWVITGGESGPRHRPVDVAWVRDINKQCAAAGVAHFFKQHGGRTHAVGGCELDGVEIKEFPERRGRATA